MISYTDTDRDPAAPALVAASLRVGPMPCGLARFLYVDRLVRKTNAVQGGMVLDGGN